MTNKPTTYAQPTQQELVACAKAVIGCIMSRTGLEVKISPTPHGVGVYDVTGTIYLGDGQRKSITYKIVPFQDNGRVSVIPPDRGYRGVSELEETVALIPQGLSMFHFEKSSYFQIFGYEHKPPVVDTK